MTKCTRTSEPPVRFLSKTCAYLLPLFFVQCGVEPLGSSQNDPSWSRVDSGSDSDAPASATLGGASGRFTGARITYPAGGQGDAEGARQRIAVGGRGGLTTSPSVGGSHSTNSSTVQAESGAAPAIEQRSGILLGFSCNGVADGSLARWLGVESIALAGTWNDRAASDQIGQYSLLEEYASWNGSIDDAIGGIFGDETWQDAAAGAFDERWAQAVASLKRAWGGREQSSLYVRFAHEFNLEGSDWSVKGSEAEHFKIAWQRFHRILKASLPKASLVWCPNDGTSAKLQLDVRDAYPGSAYVDVIGIDTYNQWPWVDSAQEFEQKIHAYNDDGSPLGAESWRLWAATKAKPLAIGEWASNGDSSKADGGGDSPDYIRRFHSWLMSHAGNGPGQIAYAVFFNCWDQFQVFPKGVQAKASEALRELY